jgi:hypothetical protein
VIPFWEHATPLVFLVLLKISSFILQQPPKQIVEGMAGRFSFNNNYEGHEHKIKGAMLTCQSRSERGRG